MCFRFQSGIHDTPKSGHTHKKNILLESKILLYLDYSYISVSYAVAHFNSSKYFIIIITLM